MRLLPHLVFAALLGGPAAAQSGSQPDNVLILLADDIGVDMVGAYGEGSKSASTPTMDSLGRNGVLFRNAWSNPMCSPTRAALHTGRYAFRHGIGSVLGGNGVGLKREELTLPEVLRDYPDVPFASAAFGKWHLGSKNDGAFAPNLAGYDHFAGSEANIVVPDSYYSWQKVVNGEKSRATTYATTETVDDALEWISTAPEPWVCYVAFHAPHSPFHAPPAELHNVDLPDVDPREQPKPFYFAMVEAMDAEMGRLLKSIGPKLARTNVFVLGDNGTPREGTTEPFTGSHAKLSPYEGGINVPFLVFGPAVQYPGSEVRAVVSVVDVFATVAELSGVEADELPADRVYDSVSLTPYLEDPNHEPLREAVYSSYFHPNGGADDPYKFWHMIRNQRFKLIAKGPDLVRLQLYDLSLDPFELVNIVLRERTAEEEAALASLVFKLRNLLDTE